MTTWKKSYDILWDLAGSPTFEALEADRSKIEPAVNQFKQKAFSYRRSPDRKMHDGTLDPRGSLRPPLQEALQELVKRIVTNPVFDDPRAEPMRDAMMLVTDIGVWSD